MTTHIRPCLGPEANPELLNIIATRLRQRHSPSVDIRDIALDACRVYCKRYGLAPVKYVSATLECRIFDVFEAMGFTTYRLIRRKYERTANALEGLAKAIEK